MITVNQLYNATNDGLLILQLHFSGVAEAAASGKKFKRRTEERTPSASVKRYPRQGGGYVWKVTDFGEDDKAKDPIQIHMEEEGMTFADAMKDLAARFNIPDEQGKTTNKPDIRKRPASPEQEDGKTYWELDQNFTEAECRIMGPLVTPEHLKALNWHRAKWVCSVKNREAIYKYPNERYPIFIRECWEEKDGVAKTFYKIYEPMNQDKGFRFQYQPKGGKPQKYTNGLFELRRQWRDYNDKAEKEFFKDPNNEGKPFKEIKFEEAVICSGERDAICVKAMGYFPVWFNSETYQISPEEIDEIFKYVKVIYNIPDIDSTGKLKGTELALKYIDIHTVWLPEELRQQTDWRGNAKKDFRDWCETHRTKKSFKNLLANADPAKFWKMTYTEKSKERKYSIDISCLHAFLNLNGFYTLHDPYKNTTVDFVKIDGNVVKQVTSKDIRAFVWNWCIKTGQPRELRNLVLSTPTLSQASLEALKEIDPDFTNYTEKSQFFYFPKFSVEVTGKELIKREYRNTVLDRYVWEDNVFPHNINLLPDMFEITHPEGDYRSESFDIKINDLSSNYLKYLINASRIYWRKELEENISWMQPEDREDYKRRYAFRIDGDDLTPEEVQEQKQCLINKIFTIGFIMHRYKMESRGWAPYVMDNKIGENGQCNGRSGKSAMFRALSHFTKWVKLSGRNPKFFDNPFHFELVNKHQTFVVIDDCDEYLPVEQFYDNITSDITINAKNKNSYNLSYLEAPKFVFTTNYVPRNFNDSTVARMLFVVFSNYYHEKTEDNDYLETRSIRDDFGKDLFSSSYSEKEWEADANFVMQCVKFYLSVAPYKVKIEPKLDNIFYRRHIQAMGDNFIGWAEGYFAQDENGKGENLDKEIVREKAFDDYKRYSGQNKITMQSFTRKLKSFCEVCEYIDCMNPSELLNSSGRIQRRVMDPFNANNTVIKDMIYIRTKKAAQEALEGRKPTNEPISESQQASGTIPEFVKDMPKQTVYKPKL